MRVSDIATTSRIAVSPKRTSSKDREANRIPLWSDHVYQEIKTTLSNPDFPCVFAKEAMKRDAISFCWLDNSNVQVDRPTAAKAIGTYLDRCSSLPPIESLLETLLIVFKPTNEIQSLDSYHKQAWAFLQWLNDHDEKAWPADIPTDPNDPLWSFCFAGVPLFVNVSAPAHAVRRSRNLCSALTLVIQPRANFDLVAGHDHPKGELVREQIRRRMDAFDLIDSPEELGTYGKSENREWHQYVLKESNEPRQDKCPLNISRKRRGGQHE